MFMRREPFDERYITCVPKSAGVYIIYDLAGPIYVGRSASNIQRRLKTHLAGRGNRNIAHAISVGAASSLSFTYYCMLSSLQGDAEAILIHELGADKYANLRRETLPEDWEQ
jgi:hypothetical protein